MSKSNELISQKGLVNLDTIQKHRNILQARGLRALGESTTNTALKTTITTIRIFSYLTVIFAIPVELFIHFYFKSNARKIIENDNIALIRTRCGFVPKAREKDFLHHNRLVNREKFLDDNSDTYKEISKAHRIYDFSRSFSNSEDANLFKLYLNSTNISTKKLKELAEKISDNRVSYQKIPQWFKSICSLNETLNIVNPSEEEKKGVYELLNHITNCGKDLSQLNDNKASQFDLIANVYREIRKQKVDADKAKKATIYLLPHIIKLYDQKRVDVAKVFTDAFIKHPYLREKIVDQHDEFIAQFNEHIDNQLSELNSTDKINEAITGFENELNYPEIPIFAKEFGLTKGVVTKVLLTGDHSDENFVKKKKTLEELKPIFVETGNLPLIQECFVLFSGKFLENKDNKDYWENWKDVMTYAKDRYSDKQYTDANLAKALFTVTNSLTTKNENNHLVAIEHLSHACDNYAIFNRDRREAIRKKIDTELALYTLKEKVKSVKVKDVSKTVAQHYGLQPEILDNYLHSPAQSDFMEQLRTLKKLSDHLPEILGSVKNSELVHAFIKCYGLEHFTKYMADSNSSEKLLKVLSYANDLSKKKVYSSGVIGEGLAETLSSLTAELNVSDVEALDSLYNAAKSFFDDDTDEQVKCILQENILKVEILQRAKAHASKNNREMATDTKLLIKNLLDSFTVHKDLPKKGTVDYITKAINKCLKLHLNQDASNDSISLSFASNSILEKVLLEIDNIGNPKFSDAVFEGIKNDAIRRDKTRDKLSIEKEKVLFPLLIELLPGFCRNIIPKDKKDVRRSVNEKLRNIRERFNSSENLQLELKEAYEHIRHTKGWLLLGPDVASPAIDTMFDGVIGELQKAKKGLNGLDSKKVNTETVKQALDKKESTAAMKAFLPISVEVLSNLHEKHNQILKIKERKGKVRIVIEGSDEKQSNTDKVGVVVLKDSEDLLMKMFEKIPDSEGKLMESINKLPRLLKLSKFLNIFGGLGSYITRKIGTKLIKEQLSKDLGMNEHHLKFIKDNIEDLLSIGIDLAPYLLQRHDVNTYLNKLQAVKNLTMSSGPLDQKQLYLSILDLVETIVTGLKKDKSIILDSIAHISENHSKH